MGPSHDLCHHPVQLSRFRGFLLLNIQLTTLPVLLRIRLTQSVILAVRLHRIKHRFKLFFWLKELQLQLLVLKPDASTPLSLPSLRVLQQQRQRDQSALLRTELQAHANAEEVAALSGQAAGIASVRNQKPQKQEQRRRLLTLISQPQLVVPPTVKEKCRKHSKQE